MAVSAKGDKPCIFVFDTRGERRKKTLTFNIEGYNIKEYVSLAFAEPKHLVFLIN